MAIYYVSKDGNNSWAGTSWDTAWLTLDKALSTGGAPADSEIWVASGTYNENHIEMDNRAYIYGGFAGNEVSRAQRRYLENKTILQFTSSARSFYNGWYGGRLDGFWFTGCTSDCSPVVLRSGLGKTDVFTVANCIFKDNVLDTGATSTFGCVTIMGNATPIYSKHVIENCVFDHNSSKYVGGIYMYYFNGVIRDCVFMNNINATAGPSNNAHELRDAGYSDPIIEYNIFWDSYSNEYSHTFDQDNSFLNIDNPVGSNNNMRRYPWFIDRNNDNYNIYNISPCARGGSDGGSIGPGGIAEVIYDFDNPMLGHNSIDDPVSEIQMSTKPIKEIAMTRNSYTAFNVDGKLMHEVILSDKAQIKLKWDVVDHTAGDKTTQTAKELYNVFRKIKETGNYPHFIPDPDLIIDPKCRYTNAGNGYMLHNCTAMTVTNQNNDGYETWSPKSPQHVNFHDLELDTISTYDPTGATYFECENVDMNTALSAFATYYLEIDLSSTGLNFQDIVRRITIDIVSSTELTTSGITNNILFAWRHDTDEWLELERFYDTWDSGADYEDRFMLNHHVITDRHNIINRYLGDTNKIYICLVCLHRNRHMFIHYARVCLNSYGVRWKSVFGLQNWKGMYNMLFEVGKTGSIDLVEV